MKYCITGVSGFLGQSVVDRILADGNEVVTIGRSEPVIEARSVHVKADITDRQSLEIVKSKHPDIRAFIHMAALVPKTKAEDIGHVMSKVNIEGTINVLEVFGGSLDRFVYVSTAEVYGSAFKEGLTKEDVTPQPVSFYGATKFAGEILSEAYGRQHNLPVACLRLTVLYGPGDTINRAIPNFINKALNGEPLTIYGGRELRDYLHVADASRAIYLTALKPISGVFNVASGKGVSILDAAQAVLRETDSKSKLEVHPKDVKGSDIVLDVSGAMKVFDFEAEYIFPDLLDEQVEWHRNHREV